MVSGEGGANSIAALPVWSAPRGSSVLTRVRSPEQLRSIAMPRIADNSHIMPVPCAKTVPLRGKPAYRFPLSNQIISRQIRIALELKATVPTLQLLRDATGGDCRMRFHPAERRSHRS